MPWQDINLIVLDCVVGIALIFGIGGGRWFGRG